MITDSTIVDRPVQPAPRTGDLSSRLVDQFFRRWVIYVLPIALFGGLGVVVAANAAPEYESVGRLNATANPLLEETPTREQVNQFEPVATGVARLINERLQTDTFLDEVASRAGLAEFVQTGGLERDVIRSQVIAEPNGNNVLSVRSLWGDPETAFLLVDATISTYREVVQNTIAQDSQDAIALLQTSREQLAERQADAEAALTSYIEANPLVSLDRDDRPIEVELTIARLNSDLETANTALSDLDDDIGEAQRAATQAQSDAGRQLTIVDEPQVPTEPEPQLLSRIVTLLMFLVLGLLVAATALGFVTYLDSSVRLPSQVRGLAASGTVVTIPALKQLSGRRRRRSRRRPSSKRVPKAEVA